MAKQILGCNIDFRAFDSTEDCIKSAVPDAALLNAVSAVSGVDATTVQNWVKRGYVSKLNGKKYSREQVAEIIILNNLKSSAELETAAKILSEAKKVTGKKAEELLCLLSSCIIRATRFNSTDRESLRGVINAVLRQEEISDRALSEFLLACSLSALASDYIRQAQREFKSV